MKYFLSSASSLSWSFSAAAQNSFTHTTGWLCWHEASKRIQVLFHLWCLIPNTPLLISSFFSHFVCRQSQFGSNWSLTKAHQIVGLVISVRRQRVILGLNLFKSRPSWAFTCFPAKQATPYMMLQHMLRRNNKDAFWGFCCSFSRGRNKGKQLDLTYVDENREM